MTLGGLSPTDPTGFLYNRSRARDWSTEKSVGSVLPVKPVRCVMELADQLGDLATRVRRLGPDRRDPHAFIEEKDDIAYQLRRLAERVAEDGE